MGFLRKVYGILSAQLTVTTLVAALFMSSERVKGFVQGSPNLLFTAMILSFVMMIALFVKRRETPTNYILLALFVSVHHSTLSCFYQLRPTTFFWDSSYHYYPLSTT